MGATSVRTVVDVVGGLRPEETPVLAAVARLDDANVSRTSRGRRRAESPGFGLAEVTAVLAPTVWPAVDEACRAAVAATLESARGRFSHGARRLPRRQPPENAVPPGASTEDGVGTRIEPGTGAGGTLVPALTRDQLELVHRRVLADAGTAGLPSAGLPSAGATALAERVVARPVLAGPPRKAQPSEEGGSRIVG